MRCSQGRSPKVRYNISPKNETETQGLRRASEVGSAFNRLQYLDIVLDARAVKNRVFLLKSCVLADGVTTPLKHRLNQGHSSHTLLKKWQFIRSYFH